MSAVSWKWSQYLARVRADRMGGGIIDDCPEETVDWGRCTIHALVWQSRGEFSSWKCQQYDDSLPRSTELEDIYIFSFGVEPEAQSGPATTLVVGSSYGIPVDRNYASVED
jgi:hypothetical protein